jgi:hypothetical protein
VRRLPFAAAHLQYVWSIIEGHMIKDRLHVNLVGENLGY